MYALLLLENEALEEALLQQNDKLRQERTDSLKEQMRSTGLSPRADEPVAQR
jgi:hypothetical protein